MSSEKDLLNMIQKMVEDKTFSMEGLQAIAKLKEQLAFNELKAIEYESKIKGYVRTIEELRDTNKTQTEKIAELQDREKAIADREKNMVALELRTAVAEAKGHAISETFNTIFKNTIVREGIQRTVVTEFPSPYQGGYPSQHSRQGDSETKTIEKE